MTSRQVTRRCCPHPAVQIWCAQCKAPTSTTALGTGYYFDANWKVRGPVRQGCRVAWPGLPAGRRHVLAALLPSRACCQVVPAASLPSASLRSCSARQPRFLARRQRQSTTASWSARTRGVGPAPRVSDGCVLAAVQHMCRVPPLGLPPQHGGAMQCGAAQPLRRPSAPSKAAAARPASCSQMARAPGVRSRAKFWCPSTRSTSTSLAWRARWVKRAAGLCGGPVWVDVTVGLVGRRRLADRPSPAAPRALPSAVHDAHSSHCGCGAPRQDPRRPLGLRRGG